MRQQAIAQKLQVVCTMTFRFQRGPLTYVYFIPKIILHKKKEELVCEMNIILYIIIK